MSLLPVLFVNVIPFTCCVNYHLSGKQPLFRLRFGSTANCTIIPKYPNPLKIYPLTCRVYTGYHSTSEKELKFVVLLSVHGNKSCCLSEQADKLCSVFQLLWVYVPYVYTSSPFDLDSGICYFIVIVPDYCLFCFTFKTRASVSVCFLRTP